MYTGQLSTMIVIIAPYPKLKETADFLAPFYDVPIKAVVGDLGEGLALAREAVGEDAILVSRGGTAKLIREALGADVIEIGVSQYDMLRILKPFIGGTSKIAVSGFRALTEQAENLCKILEIPAVFLPIDDESQMPARIEEVRNLDISCFIGDMVAIRSAANLGVPLALIESGKDSVAEALDKAIIVARNLAFRSESDLRLKAVLNTVREGIVAVDRTGAITHINRTAHELLGRNSQEGADANSIIPGSELSKAMNERHESSGKVVDLATRRLAVDVTPIVSKESVEGAVVVLQEVGKIQDMEKKVRSQLHAKGLFAKYRFEDMAARSAAMRSCLEIGKQYALSKGSILIYGETGTGKELLAQSIHNESPVRDGPFVAINCGALPPTLLESELFGYAPGAFTGAGKEGKAGLFELAHGGTIFLDEINELDVQLQGKLLRVLQEHEVMRVGGLTILPVSFRLIAASNVPLKDEMKRGRIRRDLYYRLNVLDIRIPPLRERQDDIVPLFKEFVAACAERDGEGGAPELSSLLQRNLRSYKWPGNVRELENAAEKWIVLRRLLGAELADKMVVDSLEDQKNGADTRAEAEDFLGGSLDDIISRAAKAVFEAENRNVSKAARRLGIDRQTLRKKLDL